MVHAASEDRDRFASSGDGSGASVRQAGPGAGSHRPQHISTVAHLFFQDRADAADGPSGPKDRDFVVASAGRSAVAAFAAAGLASGSRSSGTTAEGCGDVVLQEDVARIFSASSYLEPSALEKLPAAGNTRSWRLIPSGPDGRKKGGGHGGRVIWRHLGPLGSEALARMSLLITDRSLADLKTGGKDGLIWCLLENEAASLRGAMLLGSLASLLQPARIEVLMFRGFPDGPRTFGRPWQAGVGAGPAPRCQDIARRACGDVPLTATLIDFDAAAEKSVTVERTPPLVAVRERLLGSGRAGSGAV